MRGWTLLCTSALAFGIVWLVQDTKWIGDVQQRLQVSDVSKDHTTVVNPGVPHQETSHNYDAIERLYTLAQSVPAAKAVLERYQAYDAVGDGARWKYRGLGYLFWTHRMILEASFMNNNNDDGTTIVIRNVVPGSITTDCHLFTLWVRLEGPEIFAGRPIAINDDQTTSCHWEYVIPHLQQAGTYHIDVKLLVWNGHAPIKLIANPGSKTLSQCEMTSEALDNSSSNPLLTLPHEGIRGFKLYDPINSCCEICTRLPNCTKWATPPVNFNATYVNNGCEFFFDDDRYVIPSSKHLGPRRRLSGPVPVAHGSPYKSHSAAYFMGCGWSYWFTLDYPCLSGDLDDRVFVVQSEMQIPGGDSAKLLVHDEQQLPLCTKDDERGSAGRWVRGPKPMDCPSYRKDANFATKFDIVEFADDKPHCWHRDDFSKIGNKCIEMNCRFIPPNSIWRSPVHNETDWYGVWKPYNCEYLEFTKGQLQSCITKNRISSIKAVGKSIAEFLGEYLGQRLLEIQMYQPSGDSALPGNNIVLTTLGALHWAGGSDEDLEQSVAEELTKIRAKTPNASVLLVPGYFLSSERAPQTHVDRMMLVNSLFAKGNETIIDAFDMSAAFSFDTATQNDGMHIIGPTMKMIITKLFHHLCMENTEGTRVGW